ncbi:MAG: DNRLRE domain-containing protein [Acutalibacteraceae bacterium]|nr:DNRLRE domain-containing protein [Acutalibacteraceae bacterium]
MKKSRKIIAILLTVLTLMSVISAAMPVFAVEVTENAVTESGNSITEASEATETEENAEEQTATDEPEPLNEMVEWRTENTKYFRNSDGSYTAAQYSYPIHYEENGEWKEIDNTLTEESLKDNTFSEEKEFVASKTDTPVKFPDEFKKDGSKEITVNTDGYEISFSPKTSLNLFKKTEGSIKDKNELESTKIVGKFNEKQNGKITTSKELKAIDKAEAKEEINSTEKINASDIKKNNRNEKFKVENKSGAVVYEDVFNNADLEYELNNSQIKESIVVNEKRNNYVFEFNMDLGGLYPVVCQNGSINLCSDEEGKNPVAKIEAPYMVDSNGEYSDAVTMTIEPNAEKYILTITADENWLNDKARAYPVVIDPTIRLDIDAAHTYDCYVDASIPSQALPYDSWLYVGNNRNGKTRSFVKFDLPSLPGDNYLITNATVSYYQYEIDPGNGSDEFMAIHKVLEYWNNQSYNVTWNNQPDYDEDVVLDYAKFYGTNDNKLYEYKFDVTRTVKEWYEGADNFGFVLKLKDETATKRSRLVSAEHSVDNYYPSIYVTFLDNKGLESYWSYSSYSIGSAGNAYINDYTGNLVYELPILSSISERFPLTLTAYFNNYCANTALTAGKSNSSRTTIGKGFRLSLQQTVLPSTKYGLSGKEAEEEPYVYTDEDGTEHFLVKETDDGKTVYKDQEGFGLTMTTDCDITATYQITDKAHNNYYFNSEGNLGIIQDKNGNRITIDFVPASENDNFRSKTRISKITDGAGHTFTFNYYDTTTGNYVKTITDNAGRVVTFTTEDGHLKSVTYPDGTKSIIGYEYDYNGTTTDEGLINFINDNGVYGLNFNYGPKATGRQVKTVKEWCSPTYNSSTNKYESFTSGQLVSFNRSQYNTTVIRSCGMDGIHNGTNSANGDDDIVTTIQFDNTGKPTSQQVSLGDGSHSVAGAYNYTSESSSLASQNKITSSAGLGKNTVNYVKNSNAESFTGWNENYSSGSGGKAESVSTEAYIGKKSIKLSTTSVPESGNGVWAYQDIIGLRAGGTYTLSAYVKVTAFANSKDYKYLGASIAVSSRGSANNVTVFSETITKVTPTAVDNGWRRLSIKLTLPDDSTEARIFLELRSFVGIAYFDCIQFEYGTTENSYNLLENSSFEKYNEDGRVPTGWTAFGKTDSDITTATRHLNGDYSFKMYGEPDLSKGIAQYPVVHGKPEDTYIVSGWAMATAINSTYHFTTDDNGTEDDKKDDKRIDRALFEIEVKVYYDDGKGETYEEEKPTAKFNTTIEGWQYAVQAFSLKSTKHPDYQPTQIRIMPRYNRQDNVAYFDHIQLIKDAAPTYTYDDEGNVISLSENSEQNVNAEYDDNDNLTSYTDAVGNKTTLKYDSKNNLTITKSEKGVYGESFYNSTGNVTAQETRSAYSSENAALVIRSETEYSGAKSSEGIKANAYVKSTSDEHGNKTTYTFDWATGKPKTVTNANNQTTTYGYTDNKYHTLETVTAHNSKVKYTYDGNQLKQILFSNTGNTDSEKYSFEYDNFGNPKITKVGSQILSTNTYDTNNGALKSTKYGNEDKIENKYDEFGNLKKVVVTPNGKSSKERYTWAYNSAGVTTIHRDYENGRRYFYRYDSLGRLINQEIRSNEDSNHTHIGSISYEYDLRNNLTKLGFEINNKSVPQPTYYYGETGVDGSANAGKDNLITRYKISASRYVDYQYDGLNRLQNKKLSTDTPFLIDYQYKGSKRNTGEVTKYKTTQLASETLGTTKYSYTYDDVGNITVVKKNGSAYSSYTYDELSQLTRENFKKRQTNQGTVL